MSKKKEKEAKTNAMRLLDMLHVPYRHYSYECREFVDAWHTAQALGLPAEKMYKTLVTEGAPRVTDLCPAEGVWETELLAAAASLDVFTAVFVFVFATTFAFVFVVGGGLLD